MIYIFCHFYLYPLPPTIPGVKCDGNLCFKIPWPKLEVSQTHFKNFPKDIQTNPKLSKPMQTYKPIQTFPNFPWVEISLLKDFSNLKTFHKHIQTDPKLTKPMQPITNLSKTCFTFSNLFNPIQNSTNIIQIYKDLTKPLPNLSKPIQIYLNLS